MGCIQSDLAWQDIEFDSDSSDISDTSNSKDYSIRSEKTPNKGMFRRTRQSIGNRLTLSKTTRKSLEIIEKIGNRDIPTLEKVRKRISLSDAKNWSNPSNGFQALINSQTGSKLFLEFLRHEYSHENLLFWLACERLRKIVDDDLYIQEAKEIYHQFLTRQSPQEVSLDYRVKERVIEQMSNPQRGVFDEAQAKIFNLMHRDSYPRFLSTELYTGLIE